MLNFEQMRVLKTLNKLRADTHSNNINCADFYNALKNKNHYHVLKLCQSLQNAGYIENIITDHKLITKVELTYYGLIYKRLFIKEFALSIFRWIVNNLVAVAALILSIIAMQMPK